MAVFGPSRFGFKGTQRPIGGGGVMNTPAQTGPAPSCAVAASSTQNARKNLQKPFVVQSNSVLAAGAVAAAGTVHSTFLAANVPSLITTNNQFPYDVQTFGIVTIISSNIAATYIEQVALLAGLYYVESDQTGELARWPVLQTGLIVTTEGILTSGAVAHSAYYGPEVFAPWDRYYANGSTQTLVLTANIAFTSVGPINVAVTMPAKR
jgi:hypothetical protein